MKFKISWLWMIGGIGMIFASFLHLPNIIHSSLFMIIAILGFIYSGILEIMEKEVKING